MNHMGNNNTINNMDLPTWNNGISKKEYETLMKVLNIAHDKSEKNLTEMVSSLPLFNSDIYYEQAHMDIIKYHEVKSEPNLNSKKDIKSQKDYFIIKSKELIIQDMEQRISSEMDE